MRSSIPLLIGLAGCSTSLPSSDLAPTAMIEAVIANPGPATHAELQSVVASLLETDSVTLAADVFTTTSTLLIEQGVLSDTQGERVDGRNLGRPERFILLTAGSSCVVVHSVSGRRAPLRMAKCRPARSTDMQPR